VVIGLALFVLGFLLNHYLVNDHWLAGLPPWAAGIFCIYCPLRQRFMFVKLDDRGITARQYFRTTHIGWQDILALIRREHWSLFAGPAYLPVAASLGTVYSVYSGRKRLDFTSHMIDADRLASVIASASGLSWL
jgi:hypothetical protein